MAKKLSRDHELITYHRPKSPFAEAYRTLRTNLGFASVDHSYRSILVSSTSPQDGKSTTIANLAVTLAQAGKRVMLLDCDLRKPVLHHIFKVDNHQGVTNCLMHQVTIEEVAHEGVVENLTLVTSGPIPPNPAEMLGSERTRSLWPALLGKYDYVLIDAPPILAVADASILASQVDGVILVVRYAATRYDLAKKAKEQLLNANAHIIGVVLNQFKMEAKEYQYYYYYSRDSSSDTSSLKL